MVEHVLRKLKLRMYVYTVSIQHLLQHPNLPDQLQANPVYGMEPISIAEVEKGDEEYEICYM